MKKFYYLFSLIFVFGIPVLLAAITLRNIIAWSVLGVFILLILVIGSLWDIWATRHGKGDRVWLWQFNFKDNLGIKVHGLPVEEYLFYVFASLYAVFVWQAISLAMTTKELSFLLLVIVMGGWSFLGVLIPYVFKPQGDKL